MILKEQSAYTQSLSYFSCNDAIVLVLQKIYVMFNSGTAGLVAATHLFEIIEFSLNFSDEFDDSISVGPKFNFNCKAEI